uniref:Uncharacterized protein n=1 Tax=Arundo donax TaxID=35708 RepID=A0A0A9AAZ7_ARUDO
MALSPPSSYEIVITNLE